jgi:hypothetical protein
MQGVSTQDTVTFTVTNLPFSDSVNDVDGISCVSVQIHPQKPGTFRIMDSNKYVFIYMYKCMYTYVYACICLRGYIYSHKFILLYLHILIPQIKSIYMYILIIIHRIWFESYASVSPYFSGSGRCR